MEIVADPLLLPAVSGGSSVAGRRVRLALRARRMVCGNARCSRRTFAEQIPPLTRRYARRTDTFTAGLTTIALFLGGRAGARLSERITLTTCKDTLLRLIRALPLSPSSPVLHLGSTSSPYAVAVPTGPFS